MKTALAPVPGGTGTDMFVWRDQDMEEPYMRSDLYLFGVAFMGWVADGFEDGYDGHFYNGLVLGNKPSVEAARALCEHHVRKAFNIDAALAKATPPVPGGA